MERKYKIISAANVMKMIITFKDDNENIRQLSVGADILNNKVYFDGSPYECDFDWEDLEQEILAYLRPVGPELPKMPAELMQKIYDVQSGKYGNQKYPQFEEEGEV